tara:strand:+ start:1255 stop:2505 length:1251 start_codon:yes stop_codon:yes gene_type:complete
MIFYNKALEILRKNKIDIKAEIILSRDSINRISAANINSPNDYPLANNTAFDGFAVNSKETNNINNNGRKFKIIRVIAAGDNPKIKKIPKYSSIEVMTGAIIQKPFDTVIPIENIKYHPNKNKPNYIVINNKIKKNNFIRFAGSDYKKGEIILKKGQVIQPNHILAFKTLGIEKILVKKKPKIVFYATGNEITNSNKIPFWKVRNSNAYYLKSFLKNFPVEFIEKRILRDKEQKKFKKEINKNLSNNTDIVITSGAVSAGKFDFVPEIIKQFKLKKYFKGVAIRPGKPIMFSRFKKNMVFFGLPGNPISSAACFRFFIIPFLHSSMDVSGDNPIVAKIKNTFTKKKNFTRFIKGRVSFSNKGQAEFKIFKGQESYKINPFTKSNAWGFFPKGKTIFKKGTFIKCYTPTGINELFIK